MPEITFTIDPATGNLEMHVTGIAGPACEDIAKLAKELLGAPEREEQTAEYRLRVAVRPSVRPKANA
ncbi:MAG TPA: DUF2997 domain-containing protein [Thermomicrobiaceae bacterium]|nr:DUF2997 domain-containing protein [Thermomicrobiaceae bacterium]